MAGRILINNKLPGSGNILFIIGIIIFLIFIFALAKSFSKHSNLYEHLGKNNSINGILFSAIGLPLYFIFYFIQKKQIRKDLNAIEFVNDSNTEETIEEVEEIKEVEDIINTPLNKESKLLLKASIGVLILAVILVILYFVLTNNKLPQYASAAVQLAIVSVIVGAFYFIKYFIQQKEAPKNLNTIANTSISKKVKQTDNTNNSSILKDNKSLLKASMAALVLAVILVILHYVLANNKLPQYAAASTQLSVIAFIVSIFYFAKSKLN